MIVLRDHALLAQIGRFGLVGLAATGVHVTAAFCMHYIFGLAPLFSNFIAFCLAWIVAYLGHFIWTFGGLGNHRMSAWRFTVVSLLNLALNQLIVWTVTKKLNEPFSIAILLIVLIIPGLSFLVFKFWTFKEPSQTGSALN